MGSSSDKFLAASASPWRKQYAHLALGALSWTGFASFDFLPAPAAAPSMQIPAHFPKK